MVANQLEARCRCPYVAHVESIEIKVIQLANEHVITNSIQMIEIGLANRSSKYNHKL